MNSTDWMILKVLYEQQNITRAAELLFMSQPALSYRIQQLEKEFGVSILLRGKKGIRFTFQGEYLYKYATEMLKQMGSVKEYLLNMNHSVSGVLKIGATRSLIKTFLPDQLVKFTKDYPDVEFSIKSGHSADLVNLIANGDLHVGFVRDSVQWEGIKKIVMSEDIIIISSCPLSYENLPDMNMISYSSEYSLARATEHWWKSRYSVQPNILITVDSLEATREMVRHGLGYAIVPDSNPNGMNGLFQLPLITEKGEHIVRESWMIYKEDNLTSNSIRTFIRQITDSLT